MKRLLFLMLPPLLFLAVSLFPSEHVDASPILFAPKPSALEVIAEVNIFRALKNLPPYQIDSTLMTIAQSHADYIASTGVVTHFSADGTRPYQRAIAAGYFVAGDLLQGGLFSESILSGTGLTAVEVVDTWKADADNLKTMISPELKDIGVGVAIVDEVTYFVLNVAAATNDLAGSPVPPISTDARGTSSALVVISTPLEDGAIYHQVQKDEGLWSIALAYNITVEQLKLLNGLATDEIFIGQKIIIKKAEVKTITPEAIATATFGIPTSTATRHVTPTITSTITPLPTPPTSRQSGEIIVGLIILAALLAAGIGSWLGKKPEQVE